ncbi:MAG: fibronectin type III domain-containing protein, partial [Actinobacteria bacterium]|nr:fibronectin type III domain-containing protein [Actinomycetota bacterium]
MLLSKTDKGRDSSGYSKNRTRRTYDGIERERERESLRKHGRTLRARTVLLVVIISTGITMGQLSSLVNVTDGVSLTTLSDTVSPPSFPVSVLNKITVPKNCFPTLLTPRIGSTVSYAPAAHGNGEDYDNNGLLTDHKPDNGHDVILFGEKGPLGLLSDTWAWNGTNWTELYPSVSPSPRYGATLVYDPVTNTDILFGGKGPNGLLSDTWAWNGTNWTELYPSVSPPPRYGAVMSYAPGFHEGFHRNRHEKTNLSALDQKGDNGHDIILFGGKGPNGLLSDTWAWNGTNWTELYPSVSPPPRYGAVMSYAPGFHEGFHRNRHEKTNLSALDKKGGSENLGHDVILFGGKGPNGLLSDTWVWNGTNWTELYPTVSPPPLFGSFSAYDPTNQELILTTGATAPGAPTKVSAEPGNKTATVDWAPPVLDNGAPQIAYVILSAVGNHITVISGCSPPQTAVITGLSNAKRYSFYVFSVTQAGVSVASVPSNEITPFGPPLPPTNVEATSLNGAISLSWSVPFDNGSPITSYDVTVMPGSITLSVNGSATTAVIGDLANGTTYTATVTAKNAAGAGPSSLASNPVIPEGPIARPGAPANIKAYTANKAATVVWTPPSDNGEPITSYTLTATPVVDPPPTSSSLSLKPALTTTPAKLPCLITWQDKCVLPWPVSPDPTGLLPSVDPPTNFVSTYQSDVTNTALFDAACDTETNCIVVGGSSIGPLGGSSAQFAPIILQTTDSGATWSNSSFTMPPGISAGFLFSVACPTSSVCIAVGTGYSSSNQLSPLMLESTDQGTTWQYVALSSFSIDNLYGISCMSATNCIAVGVSSTAGAPEIIRTVDGGVSWQTVSVPTSPSFTNYTLFQVTCPNGLSCVGVGIEGGPAGSAGMAVVTADGGSTWSLDQVTPVVANVATLLDGVGCTSATNCIAGGVATTSPSSSSPQTVSAVTYTTTDGGVTWQQKSLPSAPSGQQSGIRGATCVISGPCYLAGFYWQPSPSSSNPNTYITAPLLDESTDQGTTWQSASPPTPPSNTDVYAFAGISCENAALCFATGAIVDITTGNYYGIIAVNTSTTCPSVTVPVGTGTTTSPAPTVIITYHTTQPLSAAVIPHLINGVTYDITITASNATGTGCSGLYRYSILIGNVHNCLNCTVTQGSGPVQTSPRIFLIFWGIDKPQQQTASNILAEENLFNDLTGSGYMSILQQYGVTGYTGFAGAYSDPNGPRHNKIVGYQQIANEIHHVLMIKRNKPNWQARSKVDNTPWLDTQFVVIPDAGTDLQPLIPIVGGGGFCSFHAYSSPRQNSHVNYVFDLVPDMYENSTIVNSCKLVRRNPGVGGSTNSEETPNLTAFTSHEFAEAATDPEPKNPAWHDPSTNPTRDNNGAEIADFCINQYDVPYYYMPTVSYLPAGPPQPYLLGAHPAQTVVQLIYSMRTNSCRGENAGGYWEVSQAGNVYNFGSAEWRGSLPAQGIAPVAPIVGIAPTPDDKGYWLVGADGGVFSFGDAVFYGSLPGLGIAPTEPIVGIAPTPDGGGYWLVASNGAVFGFGDAVFYGSLPGLGIVPTEPIVGIAPTPDGGGYRLMSENGTLYNNFGDTITVPLDGIPSTDNAHIVSFQTPANNFDVWAAGTHGSVYTAPSGAGAQSYGSLSCSAPCVAAIAASFEGLG